MLYLCHSKTIVEVYCRIWNACVITVFFSCSVQFKVVQDWLELSIAGTVNININLFSILPSPVSGLSMQVSKLLRKKHPLYRQVIYLNFIHCRQFGIINVFYVCYVVGTCCFRGGERLIQSCKRQYYVNLQRTRMWWAVRSGRQMPVHACQSFAMTCAGCVPVGILGQYGRRRGRRTAWRVFCQPTIRVISEHATDRASRWLRSPRGTHCSDNLQVN
jgi:hypothetical protein